MQNLQIEILVPLEKFEQQKNSSEYQFFLIILHISELPCEMLA